MSRKKVLFAGVAGLTLMSGCAKDLSPAISEDDAVETVLDTTGYERSEVTDLSAAASEDGYQITFEVGTKKYSFTVDKNGVIEDSRIEYNTSNPDETEAEPESEELNSQDETENADRLSGIEQGETFNSSDSSDSEISDRAVQRALEYYGLIEQEVVDMTVNETSESTEIVYHFDGTTYHLFYNPESDLIVSAYSE